MTHSHTSEKSNQDKKRKVPLWLIIVGIFVAGFIATAALNSGNDAPEQASEPDQIEETADVAAEPSEDEEPQLEITHDPDDFAEAGGTTFVEFEISDNFSQGLIATGAQRSTFEALEAAIEEHPETGRVQIVGSFPTVDEYGNEEMSDILQPVYLRETIDQINFDNWATIDIWELRDGGMVNQQLLDNR